MGEDKIKEHSSFVRKLLIANCGDSRSVLCSSGAASKWEQEGKEREGKGKRLVREEGYFFLIPLPSPIPHVFLCSSSYNRP